MNRSKLKLDPFELKDTKVLSKKFLSKIKGGDGEGYEDPKNESKIPEYTITAMAGIEVETKNEVD